MAMVKFMCIAPKDNLDPPDEISRENSDIEVRVSYHANHPRHPHPWMVENVRRVLDNYCGYEFPMVFIIDSGAFKGHIVYSFIAGDPTPAKAVARVKELILYLRIRGYGNPKLIRGGKEFSGSKWIVDSEMTKFCEEENIMVEFIEDDEAISLEEYRQMHHIGCENVDEERILNMM